MDRFTLRILGVVAVLCGAVGCNGGTNNRGPQLTKGIDRVVARSDRDGSTAEYTDSATVGRIVEAIENARSDDGVYDTPVGTYWIYCYVGAEKVHSIPECSSLFLFGGQQYRDWSGVLSELVDSVLGE